MRKYWRGKILVSDETTEDLPSDLPKYSSPFVLSIDYIRPMDMKLVSATWFRAPILYPSTIHCKFIPSKLHTHNTQHAQKLIECWSKFMRVLLEKYGYTLPCTLVVHRYTLIEQSICVCKSYVLYFKPPQSNQHILKTTSCYILKECSH